MLPLNLCKFDHPHYVCKCYILSFVLVLHNLVLLLSLGGCCHWSMFVVNLQDHINFTIGRQCFNLKQLNNAMVAFKHLLGTSSKQPPVQQAAFLREYLFVYKVSMLLNFSSNSHIAIHVCMCVRVSMCLCAFV